jgi:hypothetical protein
MGDYIGICVMNVPIKTTNKYKSYINFIDKMALFIGIE